MPITYDPTVPSGIVRLLIDDTNDAGHVFEDAEITAMLAIEGDTYMAAAQCCEVIALSETRIQKKIKVGDIQSDGPAVAKVYVDRAKALRERQRIIELEGGGGIDYAEMPGDVFSARQRIIDQFYRNAP